MLVTGSQVPWRSTLWSPLGSPGHLRCCGEDPAAAREHSAELFAVGGASADFLGSLPQSGARLSQPKSPTVSPRGFQRGGKGKLRDSLRNQLAQLVGIVGVTLKLEVGIKGPGRPGGEVHDPEVVRICVDRS